MSDTPPQLIRYGPPYGPEKLPELTKEELEAIFSSPALYLHALKTIVERDAYIAILEAAARSSLSAWCLLADYEGLNDAIASRIEELREALNSKGDA